MPLGLPKELGITGRVFTDFGSLWSNDQKNLALTPAQLAANGGVQPSHRRLQPRSGPAPASVSLGNRRSDRSGLIWRIPIKKESFDKTQLFHVSFGTRF